ncbi:MAG: hypothetical protein H6724_16665 [Sandaracinus sp.]|nr:hypothetical protein [Sandaracinus sp.]MCB9621073.1 hypothetical protein [Sandaracinus sp.]
MGLFFGFSPAHAQSEPADGVVAVVVFPSGGIDLVSVEVGSRRFTIAADGQALSGVVVDRRGVLAVPLDSFSSEARFAVSLEGEWRDARLAVSDPSTSTALLVVDTATPLVEADVEPDSAPMPSEVVVVRAGESRRVTVRTGGDGRPRFAPEVPGGALVRSDDGVVLGWTTRAARESTWRLGSVRAARALVTRSTNELARAQRMLEREWPRFYGRTRSMLGTAALETTPTAEDVLALARDAEAATEPFVHALAATYLWNVAWLTREGLGVRDAPPEAVAEQCRQAAVRFADRVARAPGNLHARSRALLAISGRHVAPRNTAFGAAPEPVEAAEDDAEENEESRWFPVLWAGFQAAPGDSAFGFSIGGLAPVWRTEGFTRVALGVGVGVDWLRAKASGFTVTELALSLPLGASIRVGRELAFLGSFAWAPSVVLAKACDGGCESATDARLGTLRLATGLAWNHASIALFSTFLVPEDGSGDVRVGVQLGTSF